MESAEKELESTKVLLLKWQSAHQTLTAQSREARRKASEIPYLTQAVKLKKKEIKLTRQKVQNLEAKIKRHEVVFAKLRDTVQNEL